TVSASANAINLTMSLLPLNRPMRREPHFSEAHINPFCRCSSIDLNQRNRQRQPIASSKRANMLPELASLKFSENGQRPAALIARLPLLGRSPAVAGRTPPGFAATPVTAKAPQGGDKGHWVA